ncbi:hypothetical protein HY634_03965 [Candidatus Uhrbacteria bacterium]|nr:hypothetical protein [Candidatus Uhrbacteria bacterium]
MDQSETVRQAFDAMGRIAQGDRDAEALVSFIRERAQELPMLRALPEPIPDISEAEFLERRANSAERAATLGIELPATYAEFLELRADVIRHRGAIPRFHVAVPDEWSLDRIAVVAIPPDAQESFLHGKHVAGYAELISVPDAAHVSCRYIALTTLPCTPEWRGFATLHAAVIARKNIEHRRSAAVSAADVQALTRELIEQKRKQADPELLDFQIDADLFLARLLNRRMRGLLFHTIATFGVERADDPIAALQACARFVLQDATRCFPEPASEVEHVDRDAQIFRCVIAHAVPRAAAKAILAGVGQAVPALHTVRTS